MDNFITLVTSAGTVEVKYSTFPGGEEYVQIQELHKLSDTIARVNITSADSKTIMRACLLADAIKQYKPYIILIADFSYLPYGRQDRVCSKGESFSIKFFVEMLKLRFNIIQAYDVHSKVSEDLISITEIPTKWFSTKNDTINTLTKLLPPDFVSLAPDAGAVHRAEQFYKPVAKLNKVRKDGRIQQTIDYISSEIVKRSENIVIADDICDGGGTFLGALKIIKDINPTAKVYLVISHGIFSKGLDILSGFEDIIIIHNKFNMKNITRTKNEN